MKKLALLLIIVLGIAGSAFSCDIEFKIVENKKDVYKPGDEITIEVQVSLSHRNCPLDLKETKFTYEGLKIISATDWKESSRGNYTRQIKVKITQDNLKDAKLSLNRKCNKEGGFGVLKLKKA